MIETIRTVITTTWPHRFDPSELCDEVSLGEGGLGLDSVEIVEVILACEEECGRSATEGPFAVLPLTIKRIADFFLS
jgi:acyl carrier protein